MTQKNFKLSIVADDDNALADALEFVTHEITKGELHGDAESDTWAATFSLTDTETPDEDLVDEAHARYLAEVGRKP